MTALTNSTNPAAADTPLAAYLAAKARHAEAERMYLRACRTFEKLAKRIGDERAYDLAGLELADRRSLDAYQAMLAARADLKAALFGATVPARVKAIGGVPCADLPVPANDG